MRIIPNQKLENVQTGNPYKGKDGFVSLEPTLTTFDIADLFPFHTVDNGSLKNIRSHILGGQIRISYYENNLLSEIELLVPDARIPEMKLNELFIGDLNVFGKTLDEIKNVLVTKGFKVLTTDAGFDLIDGSVAFYSHEFADDLNVLLDAVVLRFCPVHTLVR